MDSFGFIHGELDIKILILYVLRRLPAPVDGQTLCDLCCFDTGVGWFDYSDCLASLVERGLVEELSGERYIITDKGRLIRPVAERLARDAMISAGHESADGGVTACLSLSDGKGELLSLRVLVPDENIAEAMEKTFRRDAEGIYQQIIELFTGR